MVVIKYFKVVKKKETSHNKMFLSDVENKTTQMKWQNRENNALIK